MRVQNSPQMFLLFLFCLVSISFRLAGLVEDYLHGRVKVDEYVTGSFPLQHINEAFEELHAGRAIRSIIEVSK